MNDTLQSPERKRRVIALTALRRCLGPGIFAGLVVVVAGCGPAGPKTHPVSGKVVPAKAEDLKRLVGQAVELQSTVEPETRGWLLRMLQVHERRLTGGIGRHLLSNWPTSY